ncbi:MULTISPECIES: DnaB-like helicase C-terminal domain-containing protein [Trichocoleus]|uniref:AAA family ATPase n=1 Tax=Trichocoleus desertorum GB2-A4 TaxID=2933944 RepID=A0ABV0JEQ7_9CYAN|nr:DnaB-like helicase C-terminal domain-containing protein [Trichocoleus sp. FACHB-46]MBD1862412.1 AAA family ATPase [Trichocoleus sp. FACHB-46]
MLPDSATALIQQLYRLILHEHQQLYAVWQAADVLQSQYERSLTPETVFAHCQGRQTISIRLLQPGTNVAKAGCIDFDAPKDGSDAQALQAVLHLAQRVQQAAHERNLSTYLEFSGRRGFHLWLFAQAPLPGATWMRSLQNLCYLAGYKPKEIYPATATIAPDGKASGRPIRLPCGVHQISGKRNGFLPLQAEWDAGFPVVPEDQSSLMAQFEPMSPAAIARIAEAKLPEIQTSTDVADFQTTPKTQPPNAANFSMLESDDHPACIQYLLHQGAPTDQDYNAVNLTLSRYAITRGLERAQVVSLAKRLAEASPHHPTSKLTLEAKLRNFHGTYASASRNPQEYQWSCSYIRASQELVRGGGCTGYACPFWPWERPDGNNEAARRAEQELLGYILYHPEAGMQEALGTDLPAEGFIATESSLDPKKPPLYLHRFLWEALVALETGGKELVPSLILAQLERVGGQTSALSTEAINQAAAYLDALQAQPPCSWETFVEHLSNVRETGLRLLAQEQAATATEWLSDRGQPVMETLETLIQGSQNLQRRSAAQTLPMVAYSQDLIRDLFGKPQTAIPTPAHWLNHALNGGLHPGRLYVIGAPPGSGKTTWCAWCADEAAKARTPVLYVSFEMGRQQLWVSALARIAGLNSGLIESKHWDEPDYPHASWLKQQVAHAIRTYDQQIAEHLTLLEAGPEVTVAHLRGVIAQVRRSANLDKQAPVLVVVDYLQLMCCGDESLDSGANEVLRVSRVATGLKQLARDTHTAVIAISDINKAAYQEALRTGTLDMGALRDSFKIAHAADCIMLLQTGKAQRGNDQPRDQVDLLEERYAGNYAKLRQLQEVRDRFPLNEKAKATYARLSLLKNRGGMTAEPLFVYERAYHRFISVDLDLGGDNEFEDL